jgi:predicted TIM-barrel fold metal-dependent hydrolase
MHALGVRGIRLNLVSNGIPDPAAATVQLRNAAARISRLDWHVQIFAPGSLLQALAPAIPSLVVPVVVDHMGGADASLGLDQPGLPELRALLSGGKVWVKISGINRVSREPKGFRDALPIMRSLVAANAGRLVWGTDWPHIGPHDVGAPKTVVYMDHDNTDLLRVLGEATSNGAERRAILAENPVSLYGF